MLNTTHHKLKKLSRARKRGIFEAIMKHLKICFSSMLFIIPSENVNNAVVINYQVFVDLNREKCDKSIDYHYMSTPLFFL